jgi:AraC-like DNA-binding protein
LKTLGNSVAASDGGHHVCRRRNHTSLGRRCDVRPGKPRTIDDEGIAQLIRTTLHTRPADGSTHWSVRTVASETGVSKTSVQRYFQLFGLQPHRSEGFKLSIDPFFIEKLRDVVGLYLSPPENALVLCARRVSARRLNARSRCCRWGSATWKGVRRDYKRHGTTTLFAALNVLNGVRTRHLQAASSTSGVPSILARDRQSRATRVGHSPHRR